jgi:transcriptional regulator NrdR family protein
LVNLILKKGEKINEPFVADKIRMSLEKAAQDSGIDEVVAEKIVRETYYETIVFTVRCSEVSTEDIRNKIVEHLTASEGDDGKNAVAAAWMDYERRFK